MPILAMPRRSQMATKAEESYQVQKARKKLAKQLEEENKLVNEKAIAQMKKAMQIWIQRHKNERIKLHERLELFDENRHSAKSRSKFVAQLMKKLQKVPVKPKPIKPLVGRITK